MIIPFYKNTLQHSKPVLDALLKRRLKRGKEDAARIAERRGEAGKERPDGVLIWVHAASIGEAQSALILINTLRREYPDYQILVTTGTKTSAHMMQKQLPEGAFHQYYPLDHPDWVYGFLDHWSPDMVFWMESELWPNMLLEIQNRKIPAMLINARLSEKSYKRWKLIGKNAEKLLRTFSRVLCQSETEARYFRSLNARHVHVTDNLKYSAKALSFDEKDFKDLQASIINRPVWVYASTHADEESLAARVHERLKAELPELLTIIIPRHPERRDEIECALSITDLEYVFRGNAKKLPRENTDLYIADTLGELGLFYRASPIACIGRTFSNDGGGGHNPIEAAKLNCAILHGPKFQNLQMIFDEMHIVDAALMASGEDQLLEYLAHLFATPSYLQKQQQNAHNFAQDKAGVIERVMEHITPQMDSLALPPIEDAAQ